MFDFLSPAPTPPAVEATNGAGRVFGPGATDGASGVALSRCDRWCLRGCCLTKGNLSGAFGRSRPKRPLRHHRSLPAETTPKMKL